jgi:hypothetical protein
MRLLALTVATGVILSSTLVFGESFQSGTRVSPLNADHTAPTVPVPLPNRPSAPIPKMQSHHRIRCEVKLKFNGHETPDITVPISEPNTPVILDSPPDHIKSCAAIQTNCPSLVVAMPTPEGGICCQNGKNQLYLCKGLDLRFLKGPSQWLWLIATPVAKACAP